MIYVIFKKSIHLFGLVANKGLGCSLWALYLLHKRLVSPRNVGIWIEPTTTASEGVFLTPGPSGMSPSIDDLTWHWTRCDVHSLHPELLCSEVQVFMFLVLSDFLPLWTSFTFETISVLSNVYYLRLFSCLPPPVTLIFISNRGQFFLSPLHILFGTAGGFAHMDLPWSHSVSLFKYRSKRAESKCLQVCQSQFFRRRVMWQTASQFALSILSGRGSLGSSGLLGSWGWPAMSLRSS